MSSDKGEDGAVGVVGGVVVFVNVGVEIGVDSSSFHFFPRSHAFPLLGLEFEAFGYLAPPVPFTALQEGAVEAVNELVRDRAQVICKLQGELARLC